MATIDYKEKYEQALEKARQLCAYPTTKPFISDLQDLFPELAEDEKIRKSLLEHCRKQAEMYNTLQTAKEYNKVQSWIDWLEKQGEQKHADKSDSVLNILNKENREVKQEDLIMKPSLITVGENEMILNEVISILDNGFMPSSWERARLANGLQSIKLQQSYAWSEEDEKMITALNEYVGHLDLIYEKITIGSDDICARDFREKVQEWLKSLKPQPQQEWSEWDRILQDSSISYLCNLRDAFETKGWDKEQILKCINWLKSLGPQNRWKPSDEQMKALKHASNDCSIAFADMKILATLYEQLKALHRYEQDT